MTTNLAITVIYGPTENRIYLILEAMSVQRTRVINGHVVTKWNQDSFEVGTYGKDLLTMEQTAAKILADWVLQRAFLDVIREGQMQHSTKPKKHMQKIKSGKYGHFIPEEGGPFGSARFSGTVVTVGTIRKDGKYPVTISFGSGKSFKKLFTEEQLQTHLDKLQPWHAQPENW